MIFSEEYCSRIEDFGRGGLMTPEAVLRIFENTGSHHSDSVGDSLISGTAAGVACKRRMEIRTAAGELCAEGNAVLVRVDVSTGRLVKPAEELIALYGPEPEDETNERLPRLVAPKEFDAEVPVFLRRSDIDYNGHVHNANYFTLALEAMPKELYEKRQITSYRISYRSPIKESDVITAKLSADENSLTECFFSSDGTLKAIIRFEFTPTFL